MPNPISRVTGGGDHADLVLGLAQALAQHPGVAQLAPGKLLVASKNLHDPDFAQTVILLVQYDKQTSVGLMINVPTTKIRLADVFPEMKGRPDPVYAGGPVRLGINTLVRASAAPSGASAFLNYCTRGSTSNWWNGGGDGSVHSSVVAPAPHGLASATRFFAKASTTP